MPHPPVQHQVLDGVHVYSAEIRTTFTGTLIFGVGCRDETARTAGLARLVEHVVMQRVGKVTIQHNGVTGDETVMFHASGSPGAVVDFLRRVAVAISSVAQITDDDVARQQDVIAAELGSDDEAIGRGAYIDRFGNQGLGLLDFGSPAHRSLTRDDVVGFARTWLHRDNAVLTLTGPVPDGLSVPLPPGRGVPAQTVPRPLRESQWMANGPLPLVITAVFGPAPDPVVRTAVEVVAEGLTDELRSTRQLLSSVSPSVHALGDDTVFVAFQLDPSPAVALDAAVVALSVLDRIATDGPTEAEVGAVLDARRQLLDEPAHHEARLDALAIEVVRGRRSPTDVIDDDGPVTAEQVRSVVDAGLASRFVTFAEDLLTESDETVSDRLRLPEAGDPVPFLAALSKTERNRHTRSPGVTTFAPKWFGDMRGCSLIADTERLTMVFSDGDMVEVAFSDVVSVLVRPEHRSWALFVRGGTVVFLDEDDWRQGEKLHQLLLMRVPAELRAEMQNRSTA